MIDAVQHQQGNLIVKRFLTKREMQVVDMLAQGMTSKEIGMKLYISSHTVESHKRNLIEKMKARNTTEMVVKVIMKRLK